MSTFKPSRSAPSRSPRRSNATRRSSVRSPSRTPSELPTRATHTTPITRKCLQTTLGPMTKTPTTRGSSKSAGTGSRNSTAASTSCKTYVPIGERSSRSSSSSVPKRVWPPARRDSSRSARTATSTKKTTRKTPVSRSARSRPGKTTHWAPVTRSGLSRPGKTTRWSPVSRSSTSRNRAQGVAHETDEKKKNNTTSRCCIFSILACLAITALLALGLWWFVLREEPKVSAVEINPSSDPIAQEQLQEDQESDDSGSDSKVSADTDPKPPVDTIPQESEPEPGICSRILDTLCQPKALLGCAVGAIALYYIWDNFSLQPPTTGEHIATIVDDTIVDDTTGDDTDKGFSLFPPLRPGGEPIKVPKFDLCCHKYIPNGEVRWQCLEDDQEHWSNYWSKHPYWTRAERADVAIPEKHSQPRREPM